MKVNSQIDLNDREILAIERGPLAWMQSKQGTHQPLEAFRQGVIEKFAEIGLTVQVAPYETSQDGLYAFDVAITGKNRDGKVFDPDEMVHDTTRNTLELPDKQEGVIKGKDIARALENGDHRS
jgi:hypothetical protein